MTRTEALARLRAHEADLRALGIERLSIFGSTARGDERPDSDVDLAATLRDHVRADILEYVGVEERLAELLGTKVDLISEPVARRPRLQAQIDRDRVHVF